VAWGKLNAALRAELKDQSCARSVDDLALTGSLRIHGFSDIPADALSQAVVHRKFDAERLAVIDATRLNPVLTRFGIGVFRSILKNA
jgi:hypothetical protein